MIIDLDFKPSTYFVPRAVQEFLVTKVKSDVLRQKLITLVENGKREEFQNLLKSITDFPEIQSHLEIFPFTAEAEKQYQAAQRKTCG